jgi:integrase
MNGSIQQRGPNVWRLRVELERVNGKRRRLTVCFKGTRKEAQQRLAKMLCEVADGTMVDPTNITVGTYLNHYLDTALTLAPKTLERYRQLAARQIIPHLGAIKLKHLRPEHIGAWHAALLREGLSARTVGHAHRVLSAALRRAVESGMVGRNVAAIRKPPRVEETEIEILSPADITRVLEALEGHRLHPIVALALATGMRRGELLALQWGDVDLERAMVRVERSIEETKAGLRIKSPKTRLSRRSVTLAPDAVELLRQHKTTQARLRMELGQGKAELVFADLEGRLLSPDNLSRDWARACRRYKLPLVSFHALRHTHASLLIAAGVDILAVGRRLGHSRASTTLDKYGHLVEGADAAAARAIEGILK